MRRSFLPYSFLWLLLPAIAAADLGDGCTISIIQPGSAADKADVHLGDILLEADGKSIGTMSDLHIAVTPVEGNFVMMVRRAGKMMKLKADVHTTPGQPKLGIKCVPVKSEAGSGAASSAEIDSVELPKLVPTPTPAAAPTPVSKPDTSPLDAVMQESSESEGSASPLDCPFPIPAHAKARLTLADNHKVEGKLLSCDPQKVTIRSGLLSATFNANRIVKIEIVP